MKLFKEDVNQFIKRKGYLHTKLFYRLFKRFVEYNNFKKQLFNYHYTTILLMNNFEAYKSNKVLELEAKNNIYLMLFKSHYIIFIQTRRFIYILNFKNNCIS